MFSKIFAILLLIVSTAHAAYVPPSASSQTIGGKRDSALQTVQVPLKRGSTLVAFTAGGAGTSGYRLYFNKTAMTTQEQYQVPGGVKLKVTGFWMSCATAASNSVMFGYNTSTFTNNTTTSGDICYGPSCTVTESGVREVLVSDTAKWVDYYGEFREYTYPWIAGVCTNEENYLILGYEEPL